MPHLRLEYAQELEGLCDITAVLEQLHHAALATGQFQAAAIKVRALPCCHYLVAGQARAFAHLEVAILPGRDAVTQGAISDTLLAALVAAMPPLASASVNLTELSALAYRKHNDG
ncbi:5-carboxymethyl-2-hydroxymuconate Delta-isomerase [Ferrimonas marina]|uniref:5-carboxymethyl-2-hydroxymuconate isomerase n=1 Tax=Ferrimonas marina TaxID=299255 RepID=A0A1M5VS26_9GAMM|nr:5-carboxymethyl-2-hydroxymuconate Delta-isomerase [Ferrimonas marina]SHH78052.1 5-carboxymethyl-2-hydroxymuconate isomerase [Ferrimonas marina]